MFQWTEHKNEEYQSVWHDTYVTDDVRISLAVNNPYIEPEKDHSYYIYCYNNGKLLYKEPIDNMPLENAKKLAISEVKRFVANTKAYHETLMEMYQKLYQIIENKEGGQHDNT